MQTEKRKDISTFTVAFPEEKKDALVCFLEQNGGSLENEIISYFEKLYRKKVPLAVRQYIDSKQQPAQKQGNFHSKTEQSGG